MTDEPGMLWGGRFGGGPRPEMLGLTGSLAIDIELLDEDVASTKAHARVLVAAGLLDGDAVEAIDRTCDEVVERWREGTLTVLPTDEDVHSLVERELTARLGEVGARIHAGRSRNDLVANDLRLWCRRRAHELQGLTLDLVETLARRAEQHADSMMPGYTHLQRAQPVTLGFHLMAHAFALLRDARRFGSAESSADECALGAGALATNTLGLDPTIAARELGTASTFQNAMDAVSQRDFAADLLYACASCATHLSRLAEEVVLWSGREFAFATLPDEWSTGSSMMPQKRNPDLAELTRGRAAAVIGSVGTLLSVLKGLPLAYNRDLQEDKEIVFGAVERCVSSVVGMTHLMGAIDFATERMAAAAGSGAAWATDVAEALVGRGVPFREAHEAVGRLVRRLEEEGIDLADANAGLLRHHHPLLEDDARLADPRTSVAARGGRGGTAPAEVMRQIDVVRAEVSAARGGASGD